MIPRFRLYDPSDQKIREVAEIDWSLGIVGTCGGAIEHELDKVVLMQSTGLKDKRGYVKATSTQRQPANRVGVVEKRDNFN